VSVLNTGLMKCEHDVSNGHVFEASKVRFMLVSCDMVNSFGWLSISEVDWGCVNGHNAVSLRYTKEVLGENHRR
jgi:hypothetical protein